MGRLLAVAGVAVLVFAGTSAALTRDEEARSAALPGVLKVVADWGREGPSDGQFTNPRAIAVGPSGIVYVLDPNAYRVQAFSGDGKFVGKWGARGTFDGQFENPLGLAADKAGNVYVSDNTDRIQKFTVDGRFLSAWGKTGTGPGEFGGDVNSLATDTAGNVYALEGVFAARIQKFTPEGAYVTQWGREGSRNGEFKHADDVTVDAAGNVYVADTSNYRIQKFASDGTFISAWGSQAEFGGFGPEEVAAAPSGDIYVASGYTIQRFTSEGTFVRSFPSPQDKIDFRADDLAVGSDGDLYVLDSGEKRVIRYREGAPPAQPGRTFNAEALKGAVLVRSTPTEDFVDLTQVSQLPSGAEVDATKGQIRITSSTGSADFFGGRFVVSFTTRRTQEVGAKVRTTTNIRLSGPLKCPTKRSAGQRQLTANVNGSFATVGQYATARAHGTLWLIQDRCSGTVVSVRQGVVDVYDAPRNRTVQVRAGQKYTAEAP